METIELYVDNEPDIQFCGELIAEVSSYRAFENDSRWTELDLYRTASGKFICHQIGRTRWVGEKDRYKAAVCKTTNEVIDFFGYGRLAKELYELADIDANKKID